MIILLVICLWRPLHKPLLSSPASCMLLERLRLLAQSDSEKAAQTGDPVLDFTYGDPSGSGFPVASRRVKESGGKPKLSPPILTRRQT